MRDETKGLYATIRVHESTIRLVSTQRDEAVAALAAEREAHEKTKADLAAAEEIIILQREATENTRAELEASKAALRDAQDDFDELVEWVGLNATWPVTRAGVQNYLDQRRAISAHPAAPTTEGGAKP
jgi:membrane protein involved in colicin uptake